MAFAPSLALDPTFGIHSHKRHCSTLSSFKAKLKTFLFSQYFHPNINTQFLLVSVCLRVFVVKKKKKSIILYANCFGRTMLYMCMKYHIWFNMYHVNAQG